MISTIRKVWFVALLMALALAACSSIPTVDGVAGSLDFEGEPNPERTTLTVQLDARSVLVGLAVVLDWPDRTADACFEVMTRDAVVSVCVRCDELLGCERVDDDLEGGL